jgi:hypothetical protein
VAYCTNPPSEDGLSGTATLGTGVSAMEGGNCPDAVAGSAGNSPLVGCCEGPATGFAAPLWACYYTGTAAALMAQCTMTWITTLPTL